MTTDKNFRDQVFYLVKRIPEGKVATYGQIAQILGKPTWSRQVGWALHQNKRSFSSNKPGSGIPCHRVVDRTGRLAPNFAFDGAEEQYRRLDLEGVQFVDKMHVDLKENLWVRE